MATLRCPDMELAIGQRLDVLDAFGELRPKRVIAPVNGQGTAFLACDEEEWRAAEEEGREPAPDPFPWPLEDVREST